MTKLLARKTTLGVVIASCMAWPLTSSFAQEQGNASPDEKLVENLQGLEKAMRNQMPGLSADEIRVMRKLYNEQEAARQNPVPPTVTNKVTILERGESPSLDIMERFDTTLVFADRHGDPMEITAYRISDDEAAALVPLHGSASNAMAENDAGDEDIITPDQGEEDGPIKALIVTPLASMRSTNVTVMLRGQDFPIVLSLSTRSSVSDDIDLAYIQEMRLSWASLMPEAQALAGKFTGANGGGALSQRMVSLVQGVPDSALEEVPLRGELSRQVSLWQDKEEEDWYLRLGEHIEPWNISIKDRTNDGLRGFSVIRLDGAPPSVIGLSANGQYRTVEIKG